jgi:hypothetical protein
MILCQTFSLIMEAFQPKAYLTKYRAHPCIMTLMANYTSSKITNLVLGLLALNLFIGGIAYGCSYILFDRRTGEVQRSQFNKGKTIGGATFVGITYTVRLDDGRVVSFLNQCHPGGRGVSDCYPEDIIRTGSRVVLVEDPPGQFKFSSTSKVIEIAALIVLAPVVLVSNIVGFIQKSR